MLLNHSSLPQTALHLHLKELPPRTAPRPGFRETDPIPNANNKNYVVPAGAMEATAHQAQGSAVRAASLSTEVHSTPASSGGVGADPTSLKHAGVRLNNDNTGGDCSSGSCRRSEQRDDCSHSHSCRHRACRCENDPADVPEAVSNKEHESCLRSRERCYRDRRQQQGGVVRVRRLKAGAEGDVAHVTSRSAVASTDCCCSNNPHFNNKDGGRGVAMVVTGGSANRESGQQPLVQRISITACGDHVNDGVYRRGKRGCIANVNVCDGCHGEGGPSDGSTGGAIGVWQECSTGKCAGCLKGCQSHAFASNYDHRDLEYRRNLEYTTRKECKRKNEYADLGDEEFKYDIQETTPQTKEQSQQSDVKEAEHWPRRLCSPTSCTALDNHFHRAQHPMAAAASKGPPSSADNISSTSGYVAVAGNDSAYHAHHVGSSGYDLEKERHINSSGNSRRPIDLEEVVRKKRDGRGCKSGRDHDRVGAWESREHGTVLHRSGELFSEPAKCPRNDVLSNVAGVWLHGPSRLSSGEDVVSRPGPAVAEEESRTAGSR